jgi:hypothetical protein
VGAVYFIEGECIVVNIQFLITVVITIKRSLSWYINHELNTRSRTDLDVNRAVRRVRYTVHADVRFGTLRTSFSRSNR